MKKINYIKCVLLGFTAIAFSSCLKDKTYVDFSQGGQSAELTLSGLNSFPQDAITSDTALIQFGVNIASSSTPTTDHKITVDVVPDKLTSYLASNNTIAYELMPTNAYSFRTTVVDIPSGQRLKILTFTVLKNLLDPSKSYMLPIGITSAPGLTISANNSTHYYHVIGNDFAGAYFAQFIRTPAGGDYPHKPVTLTPVSPTLFQAVSGYAALNVHYDVSFTKTGNGATATYSKFAVTLNADDVKNIFGTANGISVTTPASFVHPPDPSKQYTYAEALTLFDFQYDVVNSAGAGRHVEDIFTKQ
ncbi:protein of unknown function [Mucilaginibacter lappiensis]|uniref:BT-3987-like N-terminal domain-containing protein n=1 Tax=Mucilaginibacter lappiensis TaxID=354630 RepID=A0ABR6PPV9_9SPHI|nr:DUF1735 domain-containing protein [Mucilaginibacter lappiensis]MBB6111812.1 hypothetical protein [Mucilaginibacter lappiensis]SIR88021.1 protein of unknown function [Mucilaginibacter lappiensis]